MNKAIFLILFGVVGMGAQASVKFDVSPYVSIKSTKSVTPGKDTVENEKVIQRRELGVKATLSLWKIFKVQASVGSSNTKTTQLVTDITDEYDEIDFQTDLAIDTSDPSAEATITEEQKIGKLSLVLDPSFSIFMARFKLGVTARQRIIDRSQAGLASARVTEGPTYKPHSGLGFGVRFSPKIYWMAEYEFYHYKYAPDIEPFERELSMSVSVAI